VKKYYKFSELPTEHQHEIVGHLGGSAVKTAWKFERKFPTEEAVQVAWDSCVMISDSRVRNVMMGLEAGGTLRPMLMDTLDEDNVWMEGHHRAFAASNLGYKTVPVFLRVE